MAAQAWRALRPPGFSFVGKQGACSTRPAVLFRGMSEYKITLTWQRGDKPFEYQKYSRDHTWKFEGGHEMQASAAPAYLGNPKLADPEEAFVASLSSCHMLTFLAIACKKKFVLDEYLVSSWLHGKNRSKLRSRVVLGKSKFSGDKQPTAGRAQKSIMPRTSSAMRVR
jgi:organic hydroperoxide reductase OsmC/OhrA